MSGLKVLHMRKTCLSIFTVLLIGHTSLAQYNELHLSLEEAITASTTGNNAVKLSDLDAQIAQVNFRQTATFFLPHVQFSYMASATNNPLNAFGLKLQQQSISEKDFIPALLNNPPATKDLSAKFDVQQSLLNVQMLYQHKSAAKEIEMYLFLCKRTKEQLRFETEKAYLQLQMAYAADKVLHETLSTAKAVYKTSKDYYDQGMILRSDLLNANIYVLNIQTQLETSRSNIEDASDMLGLLMGKPAGTVYTVDPGVINKTIIQDTFQLSDSRADFLASQRGIDGYELMIKSSRLRYLPSLNAFASYQLNDTRLSNFKAHAYFAGLQLSWNIFDAYATKNIVGRQKFEKDKLATQLKQQKAEAAIQVNHARRQLSTALFAINQASLSVEKSSEALRVIQNRYSQGLAKTSDVLLAQTQLSQQKLCYVQAILDYNIAAAYIHFLTTGQ